MDSSSSRQMFGYVFWFAVVLLVQVGAQYIGQSDSDALRWSMLFWQALHSWPHRVVGKGCENIALRKWSWTTPLRWEYHMGLQFFKTKHEWKSHEIPNLMLWSVVAIYPSCPCFFFCVLLPSFHSNNFVAEVLTFLFAGQDSTAAAMASCLCFLTASPRCKAKLLQEPRHP